MEAIDNPETRLTINQTKSPDSRIPKQNVITISLRTCVVESNSSMQDVKWPPLAFFMKATDILSENP